ncbi:hypothetical protein B0G73_12415 [Paraburkholderia sp. BL25I1N1]|nr:hypothetical protein B0G73_12415 [Paraburkholderia sp. BL25I1N1]
MGNFRMETFKRPILSFNTDKAHFFRIILQSACERTQGVEGRLFAGIWEFRRQSSEHDMTVKKQKGLAHIA